MDDKKWVWVEKYRPRKIEDCVFPKALEKTLRGIVKAQNFPHLIMSGGAGIGKSTVARALCDATNHQYKFINGSKDGGIDTLRTKIQDFASTAPYKAKMKCVIMDEADYVNASSTQPALRGFMEEFSSNCVFIFTLNYPQRLMKEIRDSRCVWLNFSIDKSERKDIKRRMMKNIIKILKKEEVEYDPESLANHITRFFPDFRRTINELQLYSVENDGVIDAGILKKDVKSDVSLEQITKFVAEKNYPKIFEWIYTHDHDPGIFDDLFRYWMKKKSLEPQALGRAADILSTFEFYSTHAVNPKLNLCGCLQQIMVNCEF